MKNNSLSVQEKANIAFIQLKILAEELIKEYEPRTLRGRRYTNALHLAILVMKNLGFSSQIICKAAGIKTIKSFYSIYDRALMHVNTSVDIRKVYETLLSGFTI